MDFNSDYLKELRENETFTNVSDEQLKRGYEISLDVKDFDRPDEYLNEDDLMAFSAYCEYVAIVNSKEELDDPYVFDEDDL